jgi:hypothetical protein
LATVIETTGLNAKAEDSSAVAFFAILWDNGKQNLEYGDFVREEPLFCDACVRFLLYNDLKTDNNRRSAAVFLSQTPSADAKNGL